MYNDLIKFYSYDAETGLFTRIYSKQRPDTVGNIMNKINTIGYITIQIYGKNYLAHRMAYLYVNKELPDNLHIDHINGVRSDNRISNLRICEHYQNMQNIKRPKNNSRTKKLGVTVTNDGRSKKFLVQIERLGFKIRKRFYSMEEAELFYLETKRVHHEFCTI